MGYIILNSGVHGGKKSAVSELVLESGKEGIIAEARDVQNHDEQVTPCHSPHKQLQNIMIRFD